MSTREEVHQILDELPEETLDRVRSLLEGFRPPATISADEQERERGERIKSFRGKYAFVPTSSEAFIQRKQEEIDLEVEQATRRGRGEG